MGASARNDKDRKVENTFSEEKNYDTALEILQSNVEAVPWMIEKFYLKGRVKMNSAGETFGSF